MLRNDRQNMQTHAALQTHKTTKILNLRSGGGSVAFLSRRVEVVTARWVVSPIYAFERVTSQECQNGILLFRVYCFGLEHLVLPDTSCTATCVASHTCS